MVDGRKFILADGKMKTAIECSSLMGAKVEIPDCIRRKHDLTRLPSGMLCVTDQMTGALSDCTFCTRIIIPWYRDLYLEHQTARSEAYQLGKEKV